MILLIDNYDSFSYNLYQLLGGILEERRREEAEGGGDAAGEELQVIRNDAYTCDQIRQMDPEGIVLSPGPGRPEDAGVCIDVVRELGSQIPILGVCLGHQAICRAYGAEVSYAKELMHGKQSPAILDTGCPVFARCSPQTMVGRYHSLAAVGSTLPPELLVTARTTDGEIMAVRHREDPVCGLQFHPESILTPEGPLMLKSWVDTLGV